MTRLTHTPISRVRHLLPALTTLLLLAGTALGCGGGGGTPPLVTTGTITGKITLDANLPIVPEGDGTRASVRIIDPQDNIASVGAPAKLAADGTFTIENVPGRQAPFYLQIMLDADADLRTAAVSTGVALNLPVQIMPDVTTTLNATVGRGFTGGTAVGLRLDSDYTGPDGRRSLATLVNYTDDTCRADLNSDGDFNDDVSPDNNNDSIGGDRNAWDSNPGSFAEVERAGLITAQTNDTLTVGGIVFRITNTTNIFDKDTNDPLLLTDFNVGDAVDVKGFTADGTSTVFAVRLRRDAQAADDDPVDPLPGKVETEREGFLQAKTATTVTVSNTTFMITGATIIVVKDSGTPIALADIPLGACVDIKGNKLPGGGISATRLRYDDTCDDGPGGGDLEVEEEGRITAISSNSLTVNDRTFEVLPPIPVTNKDTGGMIPYTDLKVGDFVKVDGIQTEAGLTASAIRFDPDEDEGFEIEREGAIQALTADSITVGGSTFSVDASTTVRNKDTGAPIPFSSLMVDQSVRVKGTQMGASIHATLIELDLEDGGTEVEREGVVEAITTSTITVAATTFEVNGATEIVIKDTDEPITLASIMLGEECDVQGLQVGSVLTATRIRVDR